MTAGTNAALAKHDLIDISHRSLSGRMSVGVQKRSDRVNRDPHGGLAVGQRRCGLYVKLCA